MKHDKGRHLGDAIGDAVESSLDDVTEVIRDKGNEMGRKAVEHLEDGRAAAADGLKGAARGLHRRADAITESAERVSAVTHKVADKVESASRYVRQNDGRDMLSDVKEIVRKRPTASILAALTVGYLAARALRDD
jgi:hypothetical protein